MNILQGNLVNLNNKSGCNTYVSSNAIEPDSWTPSFSPHEAASKRCNGWLKSPHDIWCSGKLQSLREHRPSSSPIGKGGGAYFSPRPPIVPMHVVFARVLPQDQGSVQLPHLDVIPSTLCGTTEVGDTPEIIPPVFIADSTRLLASASVYTASSRNNSQGPARVPKLTRRNSRKSKSGDMVRLLLQEFITSLPLLAPDTNAMSVETPGIPQVPSSTQHLLRRQRRSNLDHSRCNIAVQAPGPVASEKSASLASHDGEVVREALSEEWVGGVRALRDSHVRLVLHQLRHIDRLNRAVDRTFRPRPRPRSARTP